MKQCPNCGAKVNDDLSFCPKCGFVFRNPQQGRGIPTSNQVNNMQTYSAPQKKRPVWLIILAVLFFPISLTIIIIKSKKLKIIPKIALVITLWIACLVISANSRNKTVDSTSVPDPVEQVDSFSVEDKEENDEEEIIETEENNEDVSEPIKYHRDKRVNEIITRYNEIADIKVSPENVESINYGNTARIIYGDGLVVDITHNSGGVLMAEINDESSSDAAVTTALRLVTKAIDDEISDEELDKAINELRQGDYTYYTPLTLHNLKCSYQTQLLSNGETRYEVVLVGN